MIIKFNRDYPKGYYVYVHKKASTGEIFYVGKGVNKRCTSPHRSNKFWKFVALKHGVIVEIVAEGLQEWYAFELEKELVDYYGRRNDNRGSLVNLCDGGSGVPNFKFRKSTKNLISKKNKGVLNGRADRNEYNFINMVTGEKFTGTRAAFKEKFDVDLSDLIKNKKIKTVFGWALVENLPVSSEKFVVYTFKHFDGSTFIGTRTQFKLHSGVCSKPLFTGRYKQTRGWSLSK